MAQTLAELVVKLSADSAELVSHVKKSQEEVSRFAETTARATETIKHLFEFEVIKEAAEAFFEFVKGGAEAGEQLVILSQKVGVSVAEMSRLDFAAKQVGISGETLGHLIPLLAKSMGEAAEGMGHGAKAFKVLHIEATEAGGRLRSTKDVLLDIAEKFAEFDNPATKAALAMALFGKHGADMIPFLNKGADGIRELMGESDKLGRTWSDEIANGAKEFNENLKKIEGGSKMLAATIAADLAKPLGALVDEFAKGGDKAGMMKEAAEGVAGVMRLLAAALLQPYAVLGALGKSLGEVGALASAAMRGEWGEMKAIIAESDRDLEAFGKDVKGKWNAIWNSGAPKMPATPGDIAGFDELSNRGVKSNGPAFAMDEKGAKKEEAAIKSIEDRIRSLREKVATAGMGESAAQLWSLQFGNLGETIKGTGARANELRKALGDAIMAEGAAKAQLDLDKRGEEGFKTLTAEVDKSTLALMKTEGATHAARLEWDLAHGSLGKAAEQARASAKGWEELWLIEQKVQQARDNAVGEDITEGSKGLGDALDALREKTSKLSLETEQSRTEYELAHGSLKRYVDALATSPAQAQQLTDALIRQAAAFDTAKESHAMLARLEEPQRRLIQGEETLGRLYQQNRISAQQYGLEMMKLRLDTPGKASFADGYISQLGVMQRATQSFSATAGAAFGKMTDGLVDGFAQATARGIFFGESIGPALGNMARSALADVTASLVKMGEQLFIDFVIAKMLKSALNFFGGGDNIGAGGELGSAIPQGGTLGLEYFAAGGDISAGQLAIVGENGPELFRPGVSGNIVPNHALASAVPAGGVNVSIQNFGTSKGFEVEHLSPSEIRIIARDEVEKHAPNVVARDLHDPNSRTSRALQRNTDAGRRRG